MTLVITHVDERLVQGTLNPLNPNCRNEFPDYPYQYYAGSITLEHFHEIISWLEENATGNVIHNFDQGTIRYRLRTNTGAHWYTAFAFMDERSAFAFKLRWAVTYTR